MKQETLQIDFRYRFHVVVCLCKRFRRAQVSFFVNRTSQKHRRRDQPLDLFLNKYFFSFADPNPWLDAYSWYAPFWAVLNAVGVVINLAIIIQRLWIYRQVVRAFFPIAIGPFVLFIDIIRSLIQLIGVTPDPYFTTGNLTFAAGSVLLLLPMPVSSLVFPSHSDDLPATPLVSSLTHF